MNKKLPVSVNNLLTWSEKILIDAGNGSWRLDEFIPQFNMQEYRRFYDELMPHITALRQADEEMFASHIAEFENNRKMMEEAMKENVFWGSFNVFFMNYLSRGRRADDLIEVIRNIRSNMENLHYSLKIYVS